MRIFHDILLGLARTRLDLDKCERDSTRKLDLLAWRWDYCFGGSCVWKNRRRRRSQWEEMQEKGERQERKGRYEENMQQPCELAHLAVSTCLWAHGHACCNLTSYGRVDSRAMIEHHPSLCRAHSLKILHTVYFCRQRPGPFPSCASYAPCAPLTDTRR